MVRCAEVRSVCKPLAAVLLLLRAAATLECNDETTALCCLGNSTCKYVGGQATEHQYEVEGKIITINHLDGSYLNLKCEGSAVLNSPDLPSAATRSRVTAITLTSCPPPATRSLTDVFEALNVTLLSSIDAQGKLLGRLVLEEMPSAPPLDARHFLGLEHLLVLRLYVALDKHVQPNRGFLRPLTNLRLLGTKRVMLPPGELETLPPKLGSLSLDHAGVEQLPAALLNSTSLRNLTIVSKNGLNNMTVPPELVTLDLRSSAVNLTIDSVPALSLLMLTKWVNMDLKPLTRCDNLTSLTLISPAVAVLPDFWLAKCLRLEKLDFQYAKNLTSLPPNILKDVNALTELSFRYCALETLPVELLDSAPRLRKLFLMGNKLTTLPSGLFALSNDIRVLNLSSNDLDSKDLDALAPLNSLTKLYLASNPRIGDQLCDTHGKSPLHKSTHIEELILRKTSVNGICLDWRNDMRNLKMLDLRNTNVSELWFEHLQFESKARVLLQGAPVTVVGMTRSQYNTILNKPGSDAQVQLDEQLELECDCRMYWMRRALDARVNSLKNIQGLRCTEGKLLKDMVADNMVCPDDGSAVRECAAAALPAACECGWRSVEDSGSSAVVVRVDCTGRSLDRVPRPAGIPGRYYELLLSNNNITQLHADDLNTNITKLDLRNNFLTTMDGETVTKLSSFKGLLHLANNSLDCSCSSAKMVRALNSGTVNLADRELVQCAGGGLLTTAASEGCMPLLYWLACGLAVLLALAILVVVFFSSRERRFFLKAVLHRWGCLWYGAEPEEDRDRLYDAFITFSHKDEPTVLELMARLEPTYRLCVHHRDWIPGRYITEQIGESVANSRRTIALISRHYQDSGWALAEFHLAHAAAMREARPRLVVVLLEDPSVLQLDDELRGYLATNTYVRWGDSWFWDKLAAALPKPRPPAAAAATPLVPNARSPAAPTPAARARPATARQTPTAATGRPPATTPTAAHASAIPLVKKTRCPTTPTPAPTAVTVDPMLAAPAVSSTLTEGSPKRIDVKRPPPDTRVTISPDAFDVSLTMQSAIPEKRKMTAVVKLGDAMPTSRVVPPATLDVSVLQDRKPTAQDRTLPPVIQRGAYNFSNKNNKKKRVTPSHAPTALVIAR